jgi:transcriptional regulator GlxA family with amidase domain
MVRELLQELPLLHHSGSGELSPISREALEWIETHFASPVSLAQCAESIPVSAAYLCRILRKETGFSPVQHLQAKRIAHAKVLLQKSRLNISDVARRSGFGSAEHFYRVFHKHTHLTPAAFRRNIRKGR